MLNLDLLGNVETLSQSERKDTIEVSIDSLAGPVKQFIRLCTSEVPDQRPRAADILNHPVLQDVCICVVYVHVCVRMVCVLCMCVVCVLHMYVRMCVLFASVILCSLPT